MTIASEETKTIHLILGASSAGKSEYILHQIQIGVFAKNIPVILAHELVGENKNSNLVDTFDKALASECIVHYNLFRPLTNVQNGIGSDIMSDAAIVKLLDHSARIKCTFLICQRSTLAKRILLRSQIEPQLRSEISKYPSEDIFEHLCNINLEAHYKEWIDLLHKNGIEVEFVKTEDRTYGLFETEAASMAWLQKSIPAQYSSTEITSIVSKFRFEYQSISLPGGDVTKGDDRANTLALIENVFEGRSVLDIGCAYGFFCFEAEKSNASHVVGTELKRHRYLGSQILKEIFASKCKFLNKDVFSDAFEQRFDVVLLLNVIHHLKEPIKSLRIAASLTKELLIIEYPNITDPKFGDTIDTDKHELPANLPLIGVSLLKDQDQTFLFTDQAIQRILVEHEALFSKICFTNSPTAKSRRIAMCWK